jgi:hypothetical protein
MTKDEALDLALKALTPFSTPNWAGTGVDKANEAITAIKQVRALDKMAENARELGLDYEPAEVLGHNGWGFPIKSAAPVQEPCCAVIVEVFGKDWRLDYMSLPVGKHKLYTQQYIYTTPPAAQRQWVGLTDEEIDKTPCELYAPDQGGMTVEEGLELYARAIEAKLKEKNTL